MNDWSNQRGNWRLYAKVDQWWGFMAVCQGQPLVGHISQSTCCAVPFSGRVAGRSVLERVFLMSFSRSWLPQKLSGFWLHGNALPCSGLGISLFCCYLWHFNEISLKGKLLWWKNERVFSTACQKLTSMERGLHTRTVLLPSYCSAGSCFWSASMYCQRRVFLNIVMNSATDSTAMDFQLLNGKLAWCHRESLLGVRLSYGAMHITCP